MHFSSDYSLESHVAFACLKSALNAHILGIYMFPFCARRLLAASSPLSPVQAQTTCTHTPLCGDPAE